MTAYDRLAEASKSLGVNLSGSIREISRDGDSVEVAPVRVKGGWNEDLLRTCAGWPKSRTGRARCWRDLRVEFNDGFDFPWSARLYLVGRVREALGI